MSHNKSDDHVAGDAGDEHWQEPHHGQNRAEADEVLVVQLPHDTSDPVNLATRTPARTCTQNVNTLNEHHSRNVMAKSAASFPRARVQIETGMSGGGVHHR